MWDSLKPDWGVIRIVWLRPKINTLDVSRIEPKKTSESSQIGATIESNQTKPQLSIIKSKIVSRIKLKTVTRKTADDYDGDSVG